MPPPPKRQKLSSTSKSTKFHKPITRPSSKYTINPKTPTEDPVYDPTAREDYLSGFRKRKQQRVKHAREEASKKDRLAKIEARKLMRDQRQKDLESHVQAVNEILKKTREGESDAEKPEADSIVEGKAADIEDVAEVASKAELSRHEDEYVDEEKYTTVTVEPMDDSVGMEDKVGEGSESEDRGDSAKGDGKGKVRATAREIVMPDGTIKKKRIWTKDKPTATRQKKKKVKKFRYESKVERKATRSKQRAKNNDAAKTRREAAKS